MKLKRNKDGGIEFKHIEFYWRSCFWHPDEWVFEIRKDCEQGCIEYECGCFTITLQKGEHKS